MPNKKTAIDEARDFFSANQLRWEKIVDKASKHIDLLNPAEKVWFATMILLGQADNGGLISLYYNSAADHMTEILQALQQLKASKILHTIERMNTLFGDDKRLKNQDERNDIINAWEDGEYDDFIDKMDNVYYENRDSLEISLHQFILRAEH